MSRRKDKRCLMCEHKLPAARFRYLDRTKKGHHPTHCQACQKIEAQEHKLGVVYLVQQGGETP
jgi:hypothetical protein